MGGLFTTKPSGKPRVSSVAAFPFRTLNISCHSLWLAMFLLKTWLILLYESLFFSCCLYNSLFIFNFVSIISMSWCQFLGFIFIGTFCEFWTWICVSFFRLGKFLSIIISNTFSAPFSLSLYSFWTPYNTDVCCCLRGPLNYFYLNFLF